MAIAITNGSETVGTTEHFLFADSTTPSYQTVDGWLQAKIDVSALAPGDDYLFKIVEKIDTTNARIVYQCPILGAQADLVWDSPAFLMGNGYECSLDKIAGTDRSISWELVVVSGGITLVNDSASISAEYFLFADSTTPAYVTTDAVVQGFVDVSAMLDGDEYLFKVVEKADTTNARIMYEQTLRNAQSEAWTHPATLLGNGYDLSITKIAGGTRTFAWSLRQAA